MFYYFGYGSNMNPKALKAKGVEPISAEPAVLKDWMLTFNIPDFFLIEGGTGNIVPRANEEVHGVLYACSEEVGVLLDQLEAVGVNYQRTMVSVTTYTGLVVSAHVYVGLPEKLCEGYQPSRRYLNLLIRGAELSGLSKDYLKKLKSHEVKTEPVYRKFGGPAGPEFRLEDLGPTHTAFAGFVFDLSDAREDHDYLKKFMAGKDMTLFFLKRMDTSDAEETWDSVLRGELNQVQKRYLNNYLHEFQREYRLIGRMNYALDLTSSNRLISTPAREKERPSALHVIENAEVTNQFLGHENLGFLSFSHGFIPKMPPRQSLPPGFKIWDDIISDLPRLYRTLELRQTLDNMPILDASEESLGDTYLLRACAVLAMLSHAYTYVETQPPEGLPLSLSKPWASVRQRLGRDQEVLSYIDLIVYNWRLLDPTLPDPYRVENFDLLIPTVGNREERIFYGTQTEILAQCAPILGAIARSQEAAKRGDKLSVEHELAVINKVLESLVFDSLPKINPCRSSHTYVDAVTWAKTVAPFAVPFHKGVQGPSGTSSPIFNLLDVYFGRVKHETFLGKEIKGLRATYPHFWREFIDAVSRVSIANFVEESNDPSLTAAFRSTFDMYAGKNGFLGRHRTKVYGYLETAFKVGRSVTIGGFSGLFKERTWEQVDSELEYSRLERTEAFPHRCYYGTIKAIGQTHLSATESVKHIVLDISESGIVYRPGDRCGILPENSDRLVEHTLIALRATGDERVELTTEWLKAVQLRHGYQTATSLDLRTFLRFAKLRPVSPRVAEALHAYSQNPKLREAIKRQTTAQWQLSDLLWLLAEEGADPEVLWKSRFDEPFHIAHIVPPEQFRMYSISSGLETGEIPHEIHLTVGRLRYREDEHPVEHHRDRFGTASNFLATAHDRSSPVSIIIDHPPRFSLPLDPKTPIVMIGGGTGFAPFRSFIASRMQESEAGPSWLILSLKDRDHFYYQEDLIPGLASGQLDLDVVFSQEDVRPSFRKTSPAFGRFDYHAFPRAHIQDLLMEQSISERLWKLLQKKEDGGAGAHLYICGRARFAKSIHDALKKSFSRFFEGTESDKDKLSHLALATIASEGRFMQEIFTHARSWSTERRKIDVSEVAQHNSEEKGHWMIIDGVVYDLTDFMAMHPGGHGILQHYSGLDATQGFARVHHGHTEIEAMKDMYELGKVRSLDFKGRTSSVELLGEKRSVVAVAALYRKWVGILHLLVEMENALRLDQGLQQSVTTRGERGSDRTNYKLQRSIETHQRFLSGYAGELSSRPFVELWDLTRGMSGGRSQWMKEVMNAIHNIPSAGFPAAMIDSLSKALQRKISGDLSAHETEVLIHACELIERADLSLIQNLKDGLIRGVQIFEELEAEVLDQGAWRLVAELQKVPVAFESYYHETQKVFEMIGGQVQDLPKRPAYRGDETDSTLLYADRYWSFEEHKGEGYCYLRRTPVAVDSLSDFIQSNENIIELLSVRHETQGIIVDVREAPQRNDYLFEKAMNQFRLELAKAFARITVLLESTSGLLQVNRIERNEAVSTSSVTGVEVFATTSEFAALKFAASPCETPHLPSV